jgi:hypothetical protein
MSPGTGDWSRKENSDIQRIRQESSLPQDTRTLGSVHAVFICRAGEALTACQSVVFRLLRLQRRIVDDIALRTHLFSVLTQHHN